MGRFIDGIIRLLINTVIIITLLTICFIAFIFIFSKLNNISFEDTIAYVKSFGSEIVELSSNAPSTSVPSISLGDLEEENKANINDTAVVSNNNKYYFEQLDNYSKIIYTKLENNIDNLKKENYTIDFSTTFNDLLNTNNGQDVLNKSFQSALDAFFYDHPELFYIDLTKITLLVKYTSIGPITKYTVSIGPSDTNYLNNSFNSEEDVNKAIAKVENIKNNLINEISSYSEYNKLLTIHDTLVKSLEYDSLANSNNSHNIYGALIEKKVVCEGYAKTFKYILDSLGIKCILVSGTATNSSGETESHMWNYINVADNWYGVDVTWDDPIIIGGGLTKNVIRHNYFCKGYATFNESHIVNNKISDEGMAFSIPALSTKNYK